MKALEERILKDGKIIRGDILKIDNFLNHQIDVKFLNEIGKEFHELFKDKEVNKILTVEASGISIAIATAQNFNNCPVVFAKKVQASTQNDEVYSCPLYSYTRLGEYSLSVTKDYLTENDKVLIIDDFFANGEALHALIHVCRQAKAEIAGCGVVVEKSYQRGPERIHQMGYEVKALAKIKSMDDNHIEFID